jgi:nitrite reductase (NO-forming)
VARAGAVVVGVILVVGLTIAALLIRPNLVTSTIDVEKSAPANAGVAIATGHTTDVTVTIDGMSFVPARVEVPAGDNLRVTLINTGEQRHDLEFANGVSTGVLAPGAQAIVDVGVIGADLAGWCTLPGHRQMGMVLDVIATGVEPEGDDGHEMDHASSHASTSDSSATAAPSMAELALAAKAADALPAQLPPLSSTTDHHYTFRITQQQEQIAAGRSREVWTYNGTSPGPVLHGRVGDTFHITLVNDGTMGHSIDFHAGQVAPDMPMRTIEPGESLEYTFTASRSGMWMYHCSTMPMSNHIANGMFGAVVIEPDGLQAVDRSYVLVASEAYLGGDGEPADAAKVAALVPDVVAFNGRAFQYDAHPLEARVGERVRMWVLDAGPNLSSAFHVVGAQFDTVWSEGAYTVLHGDSVDGSTRGRTGAQVLSLLPAQGGFVEFVPLEAGHYPFVNHQMSLAEKGAHGVLAVVD